MPNFSQTILHSINSIALVVLVIKALVHLIFAAAVAKDTGKIVKQGRTTWLVGGMTWSFATLIGGVFIAGIYWFIHYYNALRSKL